MKNEAKTSWWFNIMAVVFSAVFGLFAVSVVSLENIREVMALLVHGGSKKYHVICMSSGTPVFAGTADTATFSRERWLLRINGDMIETNMRCAVRETDNE